MPTHNFNELAMKDNPVSTAMYVLAYPLVWVAQALRMTPNQVTLVSLGLAILSSLFLIDRNNTAFVVLWGLSHLIDYVDGTLARKTGNVRSSSFRVDHTSDLLKTIFLYLGFGVYFDTTISWIVVIITLSSILLYSHLNCELHFARKLQAFGALKTTPLKLSDKLKPSGRFVEKLKENSLFRAIYVTMFSYNGHSMLLLLFVPWNEDLGMGIMAYIAALVVWQGIMRALALQRTPKF